MADMDQMADQMSGDQADQDQGDDQESGDGVKYVMCIAVHNDGSLSFGIEQGQDAEEEAEEMNYQPVNSIKDAVRMAQDAYANGGSTGSRADEQSSFSSAGAGRRNPGSMA